MPLIVVDNSTADGPTAIGSVRRLGFFFPLGNEDFFVEFPVQHFWEQASRRSIHRSTRPIIGQNSAAG